MSAWQGLMAGGGPGTTWRARILGAGLLAALVFSAYLPALRAGFIWDDSEHVTENLTLDRPDALWRIWFDRSGQATMQYYPLAHTVFLVEHRFFHDSPLACHLLNVLLQTANALLLWMVLRQLALPGAWLAAAIWAIHPVNVESVAWVTELKNVLSGFFYLLAALAYLRFDPLLDPAQMPAGRRTGFPSTSNQSHPRHRWGFYALVLLLFAAALLTKTVTATLPVALLLLMWWKRPHLHWRRILPLVPFFALGMCAGLLTAFVEKEWVGAHGTAWRLTALQRMLIAGRALWFYAWSLIWPVHLTFSYPRWEVEPGLWWQYLFPLSIAAVLAGLWFGRRWVGRGPLAAVLFFAATLFPALGFLDVYPFRYSFVADHFQYLANIGLIALATASVVRWAGRRGVPTWEMAAGGSMLLVLLAGLSFHQASIYRNMNTLWTDTLRKNPASWLAMNNLAAMLLDSGETERAMALSDAALGVNPRNAEAYRTRAMIWQAWARREGRSDYLDKALEDYTRAIECSPELMSAREYRGILLWNTGRWSDALNDLDVVLAHVVPYKAYNVYLTRAQVLLDLGLCERALSDLEKYRELVPARQEQPTWLYKFRAEIYWKRGKQRQSKEDFRAGVADLDRALDSIPAGETVNRVEAYSLRGLCRLGLDQFDQALSDLDRAVELLPKAAKVHEYRAMCLYPLRRYDDAWAEVYQCRALGGEPDPHFLHELAEASGKSESN